MKEITLLRHGKIDSSNTYIGSTDVELSREGTEQVNKLAPALRNYTTDIVFCSPLKRCRQTSEILELDPNPVIDERLREVNFGLWEGKSFEFIQEHYGEEVERWSTGSPEFSFPEGDRIIDFQSRVQEFSRHLQALREERILIISHGGVIRHMICALLNISPENYLYFKINYGMFSTIQLYSQGGVLTGLNRRLPNG